MSARALTNSSPGFPAGSGGAKRSSVPPRGVRRRLRSTASRGLPETPRPLACPPDPLPRRFSPSWWLRVGVSCWPILPGSGPPGPPLFFPLLRDLQLWTGQPRSRSRSVAGVVLPFLAIWIFDQAPLTREAFMKESLQTQGEQKTRTCPGCNGAGFYEVVPVGHILCPGCGGTGKATMSPR